MSHSKPTCPHFRALAGHICRTFTQPVSSLQTSSFASHRWSKPVWMRVADSDRLDALRFHATDAQHVRSETACAQLTFVAYSRCLHAATVAHEVIPQRVRRAKTSESRAALQRLPFQNHKRQSTTCSQQSLSSMTHSLLMSPSAPVFLLFSFPLLRRRWSSCQRHSTQRLS